VSDSVVSVFGLRRFLVVCADGKAASGVGGGGGVGGGWGSGLRSALAYATLHCLTFGQRVLPGFYDGGRGNHGGDAELMIADRVAEAGRWSSSGGADPPREILVVDPGVDATLSAWICTAQGIVRNYSDARERIVQLASVVSLVLGTSLATGPVECRSAKRSLWQKMQARPFPLSSPCSPDIASTSWRPAPTASTLAAAAPTASTLAAAAPSASTSAAAAAAAAAESKGGARVVALLGEAAGAGICRHRALLFKVLADHSCVYPEQWAPPSWALASSSASSSDLYGSCGAKAWAIRAGLVRGVHTAGVGGGESRSGHSWCVAEVDGQLHVVELYTSGKEACALYPFGSERAREYRIVGPSPISVRTPSPLRSLQPAARHNRSASFAAVGSERLA
jgi:hypothetical protein